MKIIKRLVCFSFGNLIYGLSCFFPKNKSIWVFGSWFGEKYSDNSKYLFEYINKNNSEIRAVWLTKNKQTLDLIKKKGYEVYHMYSWRGIYLSSRAKIGIVCTGLGDINLYATGRMKLVQLWHGTPLKKVMNDDKVTRKSIPLIRKIIFPFLMKESFKKSLIISTSSEVSNIFLSAFQTTPDYIRITGYPRNDAFFMDCNAPITSRIKDYKAQEYKIGIYMPTHRGEGKINMESLFLSDIQFINDFLRKHKMILLVKFHFYHLKSLRKDLGTSNIVFVNEEDIQQDIYSILADMDFLITDYSSIYFDYLLINKPIIFAPFDLENYRKSDREFYYDYNEIVAGPIGYNWSNVLEKIGEVFKTDPYVSRRIQIRDRFNQYVDQGSSKRVLEAIRNFYNI